MTSTGASTARSGSPPAGRWRSAGGDDARRHLARRRRRSAVPTTPARGGARRRAQLTRTVRPRISTAACGPARSDVAAGEGARRRCSARSACRPTASSPSWPSETRRGLRRELQRHADLLPVHLRADRLAVAADVLDGRVYALVALSAATAEATLRRAVADFLRAAPPRCARVSATDAHLGSAAPDAGPPLHRARPTAPVNSSPTTPSTASRCSPTSPRSSTTGPRGLPPCGRCATTTASAVPTTSPPCAPSSTSTATPAAPPPRSASTSTRFATGYAARRDRTTPSG